MVHYYIMRDVAAGADCSHRPGRTYIDEVYRYSEDARRAADRYNQFCHVEGVRYIVLPHRDDTPWPMDYFDPHRAPKLESLDGGSPCLV